MRLFKHAASISFSICAALLLSACAGSPDSRYEPGVTGSGSGQATQPWDSTNDSQVGAIPAPRIVPTSKPLQCVPYARDHSAISIRGDAWTWWQSAEGRYGRNNRPAVGSVLVLRRTDHLRYGHVAVVSRILSDRKILVEHANWLNRGQIHKHLPVHDVSINNDWSLVRVWYSLGNNLGKRSYPAHGFIHPLQARVLRLQNPRMRGPDVRILQERLTHAGYKISPDGVFGSNTRDAVAAYQESKGLSNDGVAGPGTLASLGMAGTAGPSTVSEPAMARSPDGAPYVETGEASWYGQRYHGRMTASGVPYNMNDMTAAHKTLPFRTKVKVTNLANGRETMVEINDRGPFVPGRIIDLSRAAAGELGFLSSGVTDVRVEVVRDSANRSVDVGSTAHAAKASGGESREVETAPKEAAAKAEVIRETKRSADDDNQMSIGQALDNLDRDFNRVMDTFFGDGDG